MASTETVLEGCTVLSHSSASQKKGDLERLISLKRSSHPQSQPVSSHPRGAGPHRDSATIFTREIPPRDATQPATCAQHLELQGDTDEETRRREENRAWGKRERDMKISIRRSRGMDHKPGFRFPTKPQKGRGFFRRRGTATHPDHQEGGKVKTRGNSHKDKREREDDSASSRLNLNLVKSVDFTQPGSCFLLPAHHSLLN